MSFVETLRMAAEAIEKAPAGVKLHGTRHAKNWHNNPERVLGDACSLIKSAADKIEVLENEMYEIDNYPGMNMGNLGALTRAKTAAENLSDSEKAELLEHIAASLEEDGYKVVMRAASSMKMFRITKEVEL